MRRLVVCMGLAALMALFGCSDGARMPEPIGIGSDRDQLKRSPCACAEIQQRFDAWGRG